MDEVDTLIQIIAKRHGVLLGKDDPILMLHTYMEYFQGTLVSFQEEEQRKLVSALELEQQKWSEESRARAERIVNAALGSAQKNAAEICEQTSAALVKQVEHVVSAKLAEVEQKQIAVYRLALLNFASAVMVAVAGGFLWLAR